ncbi:MAG: tRNA preQ1(34) S-adenosylmethionine ribosyltransferase-isomerase QueA [bacterium]
MKLSDFNYNLPKKYIAQTPAEPRDHSKLLVLHKKTGKIEYKHFYDIADYLNENDILAANNTKVMAARIFGNKPTGAKVEILLLHQKSAKVWEALVRPAKKLKEGDAIFIKKNWDGKSLPSHPLRGEGIISAKILKEMEDGIRLVEFNKNIIDKLDEIGKIPLPPYIKADDSEIFKTRYQTVYSKILGSAAAPTAGLHFTPELILNLKKNGIKFDFITLHVGLDTFKPLQEENFKEHKMHSEYFKISEKTANNFNKAKKEGHRIIAVGTTAARALESACDKNGLFRAKEGWTNIFIYPGYEFKAVDALITNFHLPKSSLLLMVSAFACPEFIFKAYNETKKHNYRFFSFGDAMLII